MNALILSTARKITNIYQDKKNIELSVIEFEEGKKETFLPWFMEKKKPEVGGFLVKDNDGFTRFVEQLG